MASETDERGQLLLTGGPWESPDPLPLLPTPPSWQLLCLWEILGLEEAQLETTPCVPSLPQPCPLTFSPEPGAVTGPWIASVLSCRGEVRSD